MNSLIPLAISLAPELGRFLFGSQATETAQSVAQAVQSTTGTQDNVAAQAVLSRNPQVATQLRAQLAQIAAAAEAVARQSELDAVGANLKPASGTSLQAASQSGRLRMASVSQSSAPLQWAAPVISVVVLGTFGVVMWAALTRALPAGSETILNMLLGTLSAMTTSVVAYWVGSSSGSATKTDLLFRSLPPAGRQGLASDTP